MPHALGRHRPIHETGVMPDSLALIRRDSGTLGGESGAFLPAAFDLIGRRACEAENTLNTNEQTAGCEFKVGNALVPVSYLFRAREESTRMRVSQVGRDRTLGSSEVEYFLSCLFGSAPFRSR